MDQQHTDPTDPHLAVVSRIAEALLIHSGLGHDGEEFFCIGCHAGFGQTVYPEDHVLHQAESIYADLYTPAANWTGASRVTD